jgi:hypothetical protein
MALPGLSHQHELLKATKKRRRKKKRLPSTNSVNRPYGKRFLGT